ncbi:MAG: Uncharacterised protein [Prochlorococcus marinus str. MIT 9313]|nr:MAG: Uncharacterised protein [Prochlorococcus marinus str. MIT 9313]
MGRWRDQRHAGLAIAQLGDVGINFLTRQLTSLTRLCPLSHLDLKLLTAPQIFRRHTKATRGDLLNRRASRIAIAQTLNAGQGC